MTRSLGLCVAAAFGGDGAGDRQSGFLPMRHLTDDQHGDAALMQIADGRVEHLLFDADTEAPELAELEDEIVERALRTSALITPVEDEAAEERRRTGKPVLGVAAILLAAGVFQLSPLKQACLRACRSPLGFMLGHWRAGLRGSLVLGWSHAVYCLGCCWALMVVLVAAGAMGLAWVLLITAVVAAEKLLPGGEWIARATGAAFLLLGVAVALRPALVTALRAGHAM